jgi:hypothetical protein
VSRAESRGSDKRGVSLERAMLFAFRIAVQFRKAKVDHHNLARIRAEPDCQVVFLDFINLFFMIFITWLDVAMNQVHAVNMLDPRHELIQSCKF